MRIRYISSFAVSKVRTESLIIGCLRTIESHSYLIFLVVLCCCVCVSFEERESACECGRVRKRKKRGHAWSTCELDMYSRAMAKGGQKSPLAERREWLAQTVRFLGTLKHPQRPYSKTWMGEAANLETDSSHCCVTCACVSVEIPSNANKREKAKEAY